LVELMIIVSILGILAAIVLPEFQNHQQIAKETQAKANLKLLREAIERYALDFGVPPGYPDNDPTQTITTGLAFHTQLTGPGKYISRIPQNPFNDLAGVNVLPDATDFPTEPIDSYGWIYKPQTKEIRLNWTGTDSEGKLFFDY
ncbi:MAG: hypothetical protein JXB18_14760, partial [Sedimentisphaerales bacterium]|nr:hypothetical protein [Sedimentisphaerales bacterium]